MLIFQGFSIYVKFPASLFLILQKSVCALLVSRDLFEWYWNVFFIFIGTVGHTVESDYLKYDVIT